MPVPAAHTGSKQIPPANGITARQAIAQLTRKRVVFENENPQYVSLENYRLEKDSIPNSRGSVRIVKSSIKRKPL